MMNTSTKPDLALVTSLYRTTNAVVRELDQRLSREHRVTFIQAVALLAVDSFDRPQPHLVAEYLSQQSQTVTGVLDRLERIGHINRLRDLHDRRGVRLELTRTGSQLVREIRSSLERHVDDILREVDGRTRERLDEGINAMEQSVLSASTRPRPGRRSAVQIEDRALPRRGSEEE